MKRIDRYTESLLVNFLRADELQKNALNYPFISLNFRQICDLELLLNRAFYPLEGFLNQEDYDSVLDIMRLSDGSLWPIPICLDINRKTADILKPGEKICLRDDEGFLLAVMTTGDVWRPDKKREAEAVFGTSDLNSHPGVRNLYNMEEYYVGGELEGIQLPFHYDFRNLRLTPSEVHRHFAEYGWRKVIGFHTEKHLHCAHKEMILSAARKAGANIFIQPVVGLIHPGDLDHYTLVRCYQRFVEKFPKNIILLGLLPLASRKAGPREALWQAIIRRNYGCSYFMTAADQGDPYIHKESGDRFYPKYAAQELIKEHENETGIKMVPLKKWFMLKILPNIYPRTM